MNSYFKLGLIAAALAGIAFCEYEVYHAGYSAGASNVEVKAQASVIKSDQVAVAQAASAVKVQQDWSKADQSSVASAASATQAVHVVYRTITQQVVKYVQTHPSAAGCGLDADGLRIWNAANAAISASAPVAASAGVASHASGLSGSAITY